MMPTIMMTIFKDIDSDVYQVSLLLCCLNMQLNNTYEDAISYMESTILNHLFSFSIETISICSQIRIFISIFF